MILLQLPGKVRLLAAVQSSVSGSWRHTSFRAGCGCPLTSQLCVSVLEGQT